jgi:DNA-directed RNA polymerase subunit RPC12/RpoP
MRSVALELGIQCPACRKIPLNSADISVTRTGVCPYCSAVMILPSRSPDGGLARAPAVEQRRAS